MFGGAFRIFGNVPWRRGGGLPLSLHPILTLAMPRNGLDDFKRKQFLIREVAAVGLQPVSSITFETQKNLLFSNCHNMTCEECIFASTTLYPAFFLLVGGLEQKMNEVESKILVLRDQRVILDCDELMLPRKRRWSKILTT